MIWWISTAPNSSHPSTLDPLNLQPNPLKRVEFVHNVLQNFSKTDPTELQLQLLLLPL